MDHGAEHHNSEIVSDRRLAGPPGEDLGAEPMQRDAERCRSQLTDGFKRGFGHMEVGHRMDTPSMLLDNQKRRVRRVESENIRH